MQIQAGGFPGYRYPPFEPRGALGATSRASAHRLFASRLLYCRSTLKQSCSVYGERPTLAVQTDLITWVRLTGAMPQRTILEDQAHHGCDFGAGGGELERRRRWSDRAPYAGTACMCALHTHIYALSATGALCLGYE